MNQRDLQDTMNLINNYLPGKLNRPLMGYRGKETDAFATNAVETNITLEDAIGVIENKLEHLYEDFEDEDFENLEDEEDDLKLYLMTLNRLKEATLGQNSVWY